MSSSDVEDDSADYASGIPCGICYSQVSASKRRGSAKKNATCAMSEHIRSHHGHFILYADRLLRWRRDVRKELRQRETGKAITIVNSHASGRHSLLLPALASTIMASPGELMKQLTKSGLLDCLITEYSELTRGRSVSSKTTSLHRYCSRIGRDVVALTAAADAGPGIYQACARVRSQLQHALRGIIEDEYTEPNGDENGERPEEGLGPGDLAIAEIGEDIRLGNDPAPACPKAAHSSLLYTPVPSRALPTLFIFGSTAALGCTNGLADLDCCLLSLSALRINTWPPQRTQALSLLSTVLTRLRDAGMARRGKESGSSNTSQIKLVRNALVPVVKVTRSHHRSLRKKVLEAEIEHAKSHAPGDVSTAPPRRYRYRVVTSQPEDEIRQLIMVNMVKKITPYSRSIARSLADEGFIIEYNNGTVALADYMYLKGQLYPVFWDEKQLPDFFYVDFDVVCQELGLINTQLLRRYNEQHCIVRMGIVFIKEWGKACGIIDAPRGYLSSYAIAIMWIYYLLQKGFVCFVDPMPVDPGADDGGEKDGQHARRVYSISQKTPPLFPYLPLQDGIFKLDENGVEGSDKRRQTEGAHAILGAVVAGFFHFYAYEFDYGKDTLSLSRTGRLAKAERSWALEEVNEDLNAEECFSAGCSKGPFTYFVIEDPYESGLNLARHINIAKLTHIQLEMVAMAEWLRRGTAVFAGERSRTGPDGNAEWISCMAPLVHHGSPMVSFLSLVREPRGLLKKAMARRLITYRPKGGDAEDGVELEQLLTEVPLYLLSKIAASASGTQELEKVCGTLRTGRKQTQGLRRGGRSQGSRLFYADLPFPVTEECYEYLQELDGKLEDTTNLRAPDCTVSDGDAAGRSEKVAVWRHCSYYSHTCRRFFTGLRPLRCFKAHHTSVLLTLRDAANHANKFKSNHDNNCNITNDIDTNINNNRNNINSLSKTEMAIKAGGAVHIDTIKHFVMKDLSSNSEIFSFDPDVFQSILEDERFVEAFPDQAGYYRLSSQFNEVTGNKSGNNSKDDAFSSDAD